MEKIQHFERVYRDKLKKADDFTHIRKVKNEGIGRICSAVKSIKKELSFLEEARRTMKAYPAIKTKLFSVAIAGFPNVGKSTLLGKISSATPKIAAYAFTTQGINIGYATIKRHKIQYLDTPGTLNRLDKMNDIEKQAYLVLRYIADIIIYVVDLTEGYDIKKQLKLLKKMYTYDKPVIVYLSKLDILGDNEKVEAFKHQHHKEIVVTTTQEIEEYVKNQIV
jgi:nucleolar GTP-binding protein